MTMLHTEQFESEDWLKDLFDNAHDLIHILNMDGTILYVNKSWLTLLEYEEEEVISKSIFSFIDEKDQLFYFQNRDHILQSGEANRRIVFTFLTKSGKRITVEGFVSAKIKNDVPLYTRGMFRDITHQLLQEAQLQKYNQELIEKENNLQQLLIHAPDAVIVIDKESRIIFWNPKAEAVFGWTSEEVLNQPLSNKIIPAQHREAHEKGMQRFLATGQARVLNKTIEITALKKSGEEFYIALTISQTSQGGDIAFIAFVRDITEQKNSLFALEQKSKELERSNKNLEEFAYAASHDLKEPIRKIHFFSDRLKTELGDKLSDEQSHIFNRMQQATQRMGILIDDLLDYSHISLGVENLEEIDLNKKVAIVLDDLELEIKEKDATINIGDLPCIYGHRRQMQQLFQNLIGNGLKYSKPDVPPIINVSSTIVTGKDIGANLPVEKQNESFYLIEVSDNGIGFEITDAERIFNVFTRLHGNAQYKGSGVGLSIARKVVENHGGIIWAESSVGIGSTFKILLPLQQV